MIEIFSSIKLNQETLNIGFPSEINSVQAALNFVKGHIDDKKSREFHWVFAIKSLNEANHGGNVGFASEALENALDHEGWLI